MTQGLPLLKGRICLDDALHEDVDILRELSYPEKRYEFWLHLHTHRDEITAIISQHLNTPATAFQLGGVKEWIHGSFNACLPIHISEDAQKTRHLPPCAIIRFPLPYKVGEEHHPGNVDEKLRTEAATYAWLQQNRPDVPIPELLGFGFPGGRSFTPIAHVPFYVRAVWHIRRIIAWVWRRPISLYIPQQRVQLPDLGYLILEYVDRGRMLSETWEVYRGDEKRRGNLYRDLSRIMLRLANLPMPRIGSWTMDDQGTITLTNRPLTLLLHQLENAEIPTGIPRDRTYSSAESYLYDLLSCHDNRMRHQPNSVHNREDGEEQLAALAGMRTVLTRIVTPSLSTGPFVFSLTDVHHSNIFVDDGWNITSIIDLEWACARPIEMLGPPGWLSNQSLEEIAFESDEFTSLHQEFVRAVETQEMQLYRTNVIAEMMRTCWKTGPFGTRMLSSPPPCCWHSTSITSNHDSSA